MAVATVGSSVKSSALRALTMSAITAALWSPFSASAVVTGNGLNGLLPASGLSLDGVGALSNGCSSVLLAGSAWVVGAGHCAGAVGGTVTFGNGAIGMIVESVIAPSYGGVAVNDLSLMRLSIAPAGVAGYALQSASADGRTVLVAGYGDTGSGATGGVVPGGTLHYGYNQYEQILPDDPESGGYYGGNVVGYDFDDGSAALNRFGSAGLGGSEASVANGDSGGPSFSFVNGVWGIAGIHVGVADDLGTGFGGIGYDILLGAYTPWIQQVTGVPEPHAAWLVLAGLGVVVIAKRQRRRS